MNKEIKKGSVLVVFGEELPLKRMKSRDFADVVLSHKTLRQQVEEMGFVWGDLDVFIQPGNIVEASSFAEELSHLTFTDGSKISALCTYKGYELWWIKYNRIFSHFCLPYTQYTKMLDYLKDFQTVHVYQIPYSHLFSHYLKSHGCQLNIVREAKINIFSYVPLGNIIQILVTLLSLPILVLQRKRIMIFTSDKFETSRDYDFRMKFIYTELRARSLPFVEIIRSLESWKIVLHHALLRRRPVIYYEAIVYVGRIISVLSGGRRRAKRIVGSHTFDARNDPEEQFKFLIATQQLIYFYDDVWAIRIMKAVLRFIGVRAAFFTAALDRNFYAVLGCKLNRIPTVGILHGAATRHYIVYDFLPGFDGEKLLTVDRYGVWSNWWKEYYSTYSRAYRTEQLYVSGPMRPLEKHFEQTDREMERRFSRPIKVLYISEQLAVPSEVIPYLEALVKQSDNSFTISFRFRPYRDGFKEWLTKNRPDFLERESVVVSSGELQDAIKENDVVVGSHSTAVLEALFQYRVPIFFKTQKWGDYFELKNYTHEDPFFAENPIELVTKIKEAETVSKHTLEDLRERYFGDPYRNGSAWVVDQLVEMLEED